VITVEQKLMAHGSTIWLNCETCCSPAAEPAATDTGTDKQHTHFSDTPPDIQALVFALAGASLTTCSASAAISKDARLVATWLCIRKEEPLKPAVKYHLWEVCMHLLLVKECWREYWVLEWALELGAKHGAEQLVATLLQHKPGHFVRPRPGRRWYDSAPASWPLRQALWLASYNGRTPVVSLLLEHPDMTDYGVRTAICHASSQGRLDMLRVLISGRPGASRPDCFDNPLRWAVEKGQVQVMQLLVQHGADVNNTAGTPWSFCSNPAHPPLLVCALAARQSAAFEWLLANGASQAHIGQALAAVARYCLTHMMRYLLSKLVDVAENALPALREAVIYNNPGSLKLLLAAGLPFDSQTLLIAAGQPQPNRRPRQSRPNKKIMQLLLLHWAGQIPHADLQAAAEVAATHRHYKQARLLLLAGATLSPAVGRQLFVWARIVKYRDLQALLLERGVEAHDL
jgi:hypothetical protein